MNKYLSRDKNTWAKSQNRQDQLGYQTRPGQTRSSKSTFLKLGNVYFFFFNRDEYLFEITKRICLLLQYKYICSKWWNVFVPYYKRYLFQVAKVVKKVKEFLVFMQVDI